MEIVCEGQVRNGAIVPVADAPALPEGSRVRVCWEQLPAAGSTEGFDFLRRTAELSAPTGIPDLATNIDHYLYGKVSDGPQ
jgi:hypothetical protein